MKERFRLLGNALKNALSFAGDLVILNVLFLICSIPVFTIGASASACYAGLFRTLQKKETGWSSAPTSKISARRFGRRRRGGCWSYSLQ